MFGVPALHTWTKMLNVSERVITRSLLTLHWWPTVLGTPQGKWLKMWISSCACSQTVQMASQTSPELFKIQARLVKRFWRHMMPCDSLHLLHSVSTFACQRLRVSVKLSCNPPPPPPILCVHAHLCQTTRQADCNHRWGRQDLPCEIVIKLRLHT